MLHKIRPPVPKAVLIIIALILVGSVAKGGQVFQSEKGQYVSIVVTVVPSDAHKNDFYATQLELGVRRIEFDDQGKVTSVLGVNPKITRMFGDDLKVTSTEKLIAKNGVIELSLEGGRKLLLPIDPSRTCRINNADFLLTPKPNGAGAKQAEKGHYVTIIVKIDPSDAPYPGGPSNLLHLHQRQVLLEVTRIEWDRDGKTTAVFGINPKMEQYIFNVQANRTMPGKDLKIISPTDKLVARNGVIELSLEGYEGHKLLLPMKFDEGCDIKNADWLLTQK